MTADIKSYPAYKDSGVPWLGKVPEHWNVKRNKLFLREVNQRSEDGTEELLTVSQYTGVTRRRERSLGEGDLLTHATSLVGHKRVGPGDLVVNIMLAWNGSLGVSSLAGIVSPAYCVYRAGPQSEPRFLHYLYRTPLFTGAFKTVSTGVVDSRLRLYPDVFFGMSSLLPPFPEQASIVRYLDHADRKVRHAIRARQQLIKLLTEQKQAIIQRAVTRGLDPNVRLKPSGVSWLGDVPEHWQVTRLARVVRNSNAGEVIDKGWWGRGKEVLYTCARDPFQSDYPNFPARKRTTGIDLLVTRNGTPYVHRPVADALYSNVVQRINLVPGSNRQYVALSLEEAARSMKGYGVSIESLNYDMWKQLVLVVPPPVEQAAIVQYVDATTVTLDKAIYAARREIDLLREYRTRLIADVVTGKLDVRDVTVPADETDAMPEELESIDDVEAIDQTDDAVEADSGAEENA